MNDFMQWVSRKLFGWLEKNQPEEMRRRIRAMSERVGSDVAMKLSMAYMDHERLVHCAACPSRQGLHKVVIEARDTYLCDKHYAKWQSQQMAATMRGNL